MTRKLFEVVELTCTCELGIAGERAVVTLLEPWNGYMLMTLVFCGELRADAQRGDNWRTSARVARTGADYKFLRSVEIAP